MTTKTTIEANIDANIPTNGLAQITAAVLRPELKAIVDFANELTLKAIATSTLATVDDQVVTVDDSGGDVTYTLLAAAVVAETTIVVKKMSASNTTIIQANGAETIDGANTKVLSSQYEALTVYSTGTEWIIL